MSLITMERTIKIVLVSTLPYLAAKKKKFLIHSLSYAVLWNGNEKRSIQSIPIKPHEIQGEGGVAREV
jgi:hypothetical protein